MLNFDMNEYCYGCGTCKYVCPKQAIKMINNEDGFIIPKIDESRCIKCGLCEKKCIYLNKVISNSKTDITASSCYMMYFLNDKILESASGGIFYGIAVKAIELGYEVCGCIWDEKQRAIHVVTNDMKTLAKMQGSKYVQSKLGETYRTIHKLLHNDNKKILFVGTPCQVAGLKSFLGRDHDNLFTIDIICHGVPSQKMFKQYLAWQKKKLKEDITEFDFRCKTKSGWGMFGKMQLSSKKEININSIYDPYIGNFLQCNTYRESCYSCKYASKDRVGDLTLGDYWGILKEHPEFYSSKGVSCVLVNTDKGNLIWEKCKPYLNYVESSIEKVSKHNVNLIHPSIRPERRDNIYKELNSKSFQDAMFVKVGMKTKFKSAIPYQMKQAAQKLFCLIKLGSRK